MATPGFPKPSRDMEKKKSRGSFGQQNFLGLKYYEQLFLTAGNLITFTVRFYLIIVHWLLIK